MVTMRFTRRDVISCRKFGTDTILATSNPVTRQFVRLYDSTILSRMVVDFAHFPAIPVDSYRHGQNQPGGV